MTDKQTDKWVESITNIACEAIGECSIAESACGTVRFNADKTEQTIIINEETLEIIEIY